MCPETSLRELRDRFMYFYGIFFSFVPLKRASLKKLGCFEIGGTRTQKRFKNTFLSVLHFEQNIKLRRNYIV